MATVPDRRRMIANAVRQFYFDAPGGYPGVPSHLQAKAAGAWFFGQGLDETGRCVIDGAHQGTRRPVQPGRCMAFDGVDDAIDVGNVAALNFQRTTPFSFSAWVNRSPGGEQCLMGKFSTYVGWEISIFTGKVGFWFANTIATNNILVLDQVDIPAGWNHVAVTYDGSSQAAGVKIYINGVQRSVNVTYDNLSSSITYAAFGASIGRRVSVESQFAGKLFDVRVYNRALQAGEILQIKNTSKPNGRPEVALYADNLVGHWKLDDTTTTKRDSSGNGYHGSVLGGAAIYTGNDVPFSWQNEVGYSGTTDLIPQNSKFQAQDVTGANLAFTGQVPRDAKLIDSFCGSFDGVDDHAITTSSPAIAGSFSLSAWVKWDGTGNRAILGRYETGNGYLLYLGSGGDLQLYSSAGGVAGFATSSPAGVSINTWTHVAGVWNGSSVSLYINGQPVASAPAGTLANPTSPASHFVIGAFQGGSSSKIGGQIADARVYNSALSAQDIASIAAGREITPQPVGHWPLQEGAGSTLYDVSGNGNHATLTGATLGTFWGTRQSVVHRNIRRGFRFVENRISYSEPANSGQADNFGGGIVFRSATGVMAPQAANEVYFPNNAQLRYWYGSYVPSTDDPGVNLTVGCLVVMDDGTAPAVGFNTATGDFSVVINGSVGPHTATRVTDLGGGLFLVESDQTNLNSGAATFGLIKYETQSTRAFSVSKLWVRRTGTRAIYQRTTGQPITRERRIPSRNDMVGAADGNPISNPSGPFHNQAETRIDFTGGVPAAPWTDGLTVPTAYEFGQTPAGLVKSTETVGGTSNENSFYMLLAE